MKNRIAFGIVIVLLLITSCATAYVTSLTIVDDPSATPSNISSTANARFNYTDINGKNYQIDNNMWGIPSHGQDGVCEVFTETLAGVPAFGWSWNTWHGEDVLAYPEIGYGISPNGGGSWGSKKDFPATIKSLAGKTVTANIDVVSKYSDNGIWDLAFDVWVTPGSGANTANNSYEIMIWLDRNRQVPSGTDIMDNFSYTDTKGTKDFVVYATKHNEIKADGYSWTCLSYIDSDSVNAPDSTYYSDPSFNISAFVNDAVTRFAGYGLKDTFYISSIEFGNEVIDGSGITEIKNWSITVQ